MRIAINGWFWDEPGTGSGQYLRHLVEAMLQQAPHHDYLLALPRPAAGPTPQGMRVVTQPAAAGHWGKLWFEQAAFPRLCRRLQAQAALVPYWASPLLPTCPTLVTVHDLIPLLLPAYRGGALGALYLRLVSASARRARLVLTDSEASRRDIARRLGIPGQRLRAIPLAADQRFHRVSDPALRESVRRRYGLPARFILYLGGFDQRKGVETLLQAFARWPISVGQGPDAPCLALAGRLPTKKSPLFPDPLALAAQLGLGQRVLFPGWVEDADKAALYSLADFFVFPSFYEGFGLPVLEAMACGAAVIASSAASVPEIVGEAGVLVPPGDAATLAQAMAELWQDAQAREAWGRRAQQRAAQFSWAEAARRTLACLDEAAAD
ncbi:MAG: glycosyltransferase family 4 protein [Chloroflexi bacterium]|nr:glycosyltransferase family 4 protein [Chloroflexota bacterium]